MVLLLVVVLVSGCVGGDRESQDKQASLRDATPETQQLSNDITEVDSIDTDVGVEDLDNIDIDTSLFD